MFLFSSQLILLNEITCLRYFDLFYLLQTKNLKPWNGNRNIVTGKPQQSTISLNVMNLHSLYILKNHNPGKAYLVNVCFRNLLLHKICVPCMVTSRAMISVWESIYRLKIFEPKIELQASSFDNFCTWRWNWDFRDGKDKIKQEPMYQR